MIGLGNLLLKDDGIGPRVIQELHKEKLPTGIKAVEAGGSFYNYWDLFRESRYIIAVDSMQGGGQPGTVYMLDANQINYPVQALGAVHEVHFLDVLKLARHYSANPDVTIIGMEPKEIDFSLELSPEISARLPALVKLVKETYQQLLYS